MPQGHLRSVQHQGADDHRGDGRGRTPGEEEHWDSWYRGPRHAKRARARVTGFISGLKSYSDGQWNELDDKLNANFQDPRPVKFTEVWVGMVRDSGPPNWANMQWYDGMEAFTAGQAGMIADCDFFAAGYEDPTKSKWRARSVTR
jgi:hypothetical protein